MLLNAFKCSGSPICLVYTEKGYRIYINWQAVAEYYVTHPTLQH